MLSDGGVHSHITHLYALLELAKRMVLKMCMFTVYGWKRYSYGWWQRLYCCIVYDKMKEIGVGKIASIMGRYYAMDRDNRWDRIETAYKALTEGVGKTTPLRKLCN